MKWTKETEAKWENRGFKIEMITYPTKSEES